MKKKKALHIRKNKNKKNKKNTKINENNEIKLINELNNLELDINIEEINKNVNKELDEDEMEEFKILKFRKKYKEDCIKEIKNNKMDSKYITNFKNEDIVKFNNEIESLEK